MFMWDYATSPKAVSALSQKSKGGGGCRKPVEQQRLSLQKYSHSFSFWILLCLKHKQQNTFGFHLPVNS